MATIASLVVAVSANTAAMRKDFKTATKDVGHFSRSVQGGNQALGMLKSGLGMIGVGIGVAALTSEFNSLRLTIDRSAKSARMLGIEVQDLRGLEFAADITGLGGERVGAALKTLEKRLGEAARGSGAALPALKELSLEAGNLIDLDVREVLGQIADRYAKIESPAQRAAIAANLFSKANVDMGLLLRDGSAGIAALVDEYQRLNGVTTESAKKIEDLNDQITRIKTRWGGVKEGALVGYMNLVDLISGETGVPDWAKEADEREKQAKQAAEREADRVAALRREWEEHEKTRLRAADASKASLDVFARGLSDEIARLRDGVDPLDQAFEQLWEKAAKALDPQDAVKYRRELQKQVAVLKDAREQQEAQARAAAQQRERTAAGESLRESLREPFQEFADEIADVRLLRMNNAIDDATLRKAEEAAAIRYLKTRPEFREPVLIGAAQQGSAAAYEAIIKSQHRTEVPEDKVRAAMEKALAEAQKQTQLLQQIAQKQPKIVKAPP